MADQGPLVRVYRQDGSGMKMSRKDAEAFVAANEGARIEGEEAIAAASVESTTTTDGSDSDDADDSKTKTRKR